MKMEDMVTYLEAKGFTVEKKYETVNQRYSFTITKDGITYSDYFVYPASANSMERNLQQENFLDSLFRGYERYAKSATRDRNDSLSACSFAFAVNATMPLSQQSLKPQIKNVIFNDPATIVFWTDGTKTVVKAQDDDVFDPEKGLAMAISKKALGNKGNYCNELKKWLPKEEPVSDGDLIIAKGLMDGLADIDEEYQEKPVKFDKEAERKDIEANRMALCDHFVDFVLGRRGNLAEEYRKEEKRSKVEKAYNLLLRSTLGDLDYSTLLHPIEEAVSLLGEALED